MTGKKTPGHASWAVSARMPSPASASHPGLSSARYPDRSSAICPVLSRHGQSSVEVLVYLGFFMLMFVSLSLLFLSQVHQDISQREMQLSQSVAAQVAQSVDLALLAGPGFNATFPIPESISGRPYSINFTDDGSLYIYIDRGELSPPQVFYFPLSTRSIVLGCIDLPRSPASPCPGNQMHPYIDVQGRPRMEWGVNASKGTLNIENVLDTSGASILKVS